MKIAAIGNSVFISGFMLAGVEGYEIDNNELVPLLRELIRNNKYGVFILPERFVEITQDLRSRIIREGKIAPVFAFIPDYTNVKGRRIEELKKITSLAVGAELRL